jgi:hypothetical protein
MPTSTDPLLRSAHFLRVLRMAVADAKRPIDKRLAWAELKSACAILGVIDFDDLSGHFYVGTVEGVWMLRQPQRPVGQVGVSAFREWADAFDADLAERLKRLASGDVEARS